jgi:prepilin-type N-terminal cleavage/methylation domain-containing protein
MRPTSATGNKGFTLLEILVVVAIPGIVIALAAVNLLDS